MAACLLAVGCEESVNTRLDIDRPFTLWGLINPKADTHAVRIFEIENTIRLVRPDPIDATVTSILLQTGEQHTWRDSVIQLGDGDYRHVYWASFEAAAGETYRLEARRSDGATSRAETTVPPPIALDVLEPNLNRVTEAIQPIFISGTPPTLPRIDVEYIVVGIRPGGTVPIFNPVTISYSGKQQEDEGGWLLEIDLLADFRFIFQIFEDDPELSTEIVNLRDIELRVHVGDANWVSPVGVFDPEVLVEPGVLTNVENGFGFFGSGYVESIRFLPPFALLARAGFTGTG